MTLVYRVFEGKIYTVKPFLAIIFKLWVVMGYYYNSSAHNYSLIYFEKATDNMVKIFALKKFS